MTKSKWLVLSLLVLVMAGCSQSIDKQIIGTWEAIEHNEKKCDPDITDIDDKITFSEDGTIIGIEGFKTYKTEATDHDKYDYAVLSGSYEDNTRYRIKIDAEVMHIVEDDDDYDFESVTACHMEKSE